ncbi:protein kinase [Streptomyces sp. NPDC059152]|uniref:protein kinase domain-containing protein n=1 Tax=Streptomyces sp. NPDC059152 TaxID=3346742 RepID=UPI0036A25DE4
MGIFGGEGRLIGDRYRLGIRLGRGGMGTVWRATDELLGRQVAVKELNVDDLAAEPEARVQRDRAMREARTVAQVKHPHVIVVHDVVEQDGRPWIVMELVEGPSLADRRLGRPRWRRGGRRRLPGERRGQRRRRRPGAPRTPAPPRRPPPTRGSRTGAARRARRTRRAAPRKAPGPRSP